MKLLITTACCILCISLAAQHNKQIGVAITNSNSAFPFSKFGGLFKAPLHPGAEFSYNFNWKTKPRHDWYQQIILGYFYHRFVQHGITLYTNAGYRYKFSSRIFAEASLGAGYLHSIPATAKLRLDDNGNYNNNKGIGRAQAMMVFNIGSGYTINPSVKKPVTLFANYQQRIQTPFVQSYVPLLPYNSIMIGARIRMKTH
jgi:hypothetical protein